MKGRNILKRSIDLAIALVSLLPALLVCLCVGLVVSADLRCNPFFIQSRIGRGKQKFRLIKMRTMPAGTASVPSHEVGEIQITRIGATIRRLKLDEIPQIFCVLQGSMSFVGPRPCLPSQYDLIEAREALGVFALRPGITGLAQVQGIDMSTPLKLATVDAQYLATQSTLSDMAILYRTFIGGGRGDAANAQR